MIYTVFTIINMALTALFYVIFAQVILSWLLAFGVVNYSNDFVRTVAQVLDRITGPIYRPIRKIMPDFGPIDLSPLIVIFGIWILQDAVLPGLYAELGPTLIR